LHGALEGQRCFIIGCGPSITSQNLLPLQTETCIGLNEFYLHPDARSIGLRYYLFSGAANHPKIPRVRILNMYRDMHVRTGSAILLLHRRDRELVEGEGLLDGRTVFYLDFACQWEQVDARGIDATQQMYRAQNVAVMAIQVAIYMGCSEIVLLGLDHDWLSRFAGRLPTHFYRPGESATERDGVLDWQGVNYRFYLERLLTLWNQYEYLRRFAESKGIRILNATKGGVLDVFDRVEYEDLVGEIRT
jgi:hypothetical protein